MFKTKDVLRHSIVKDLNVHAVDTEPELHSKTHSGGSWMLSSEIQTTMTIQITCIVDLVFGLLSPSDPPAGTTYYGYSCAVGCNVKKGNCLESRLSN